MNPAAATTRSIGVSSSCFWMNSRSFAASSASMEAIVTVAPFCWTVFPTAFNRSMFLATIDIWFPYSLHSQRTRYRLRILQRHLLSDS